MSVCLHISKTTCPNFLRMMPAAVDRSSDDNAVGYTCYRCLRYVLPASWITDPQTCPSFLFAANALFRQGR